MIHRFFAVCTVGALCWFGCIPADCQTSQPKTSTPWAKRAVGGQPDIEGYWSSAIITPFERPANLADKKQLTEEEAAKFEAQASSVASAPPREGDVGVEMWLDRGSKVAKTRQTSLVVDPADGRVPLTAEAEAKREYARAHETDSYEFLSPWDRCVTRGVPANMFPAGHNNALQIIQTPGQVVIVSEMIHETRVIRLDGSPHAAASLRLWSGDARGHWEGHTLVVDTTNFNGKGWIATSASQGRIRGVPQTEQAHLIERFTRTDADTLLYEVTIEDPPMYSKPWTVSMPLVRDEGYRMFEYACHEGNQAVELILGGGRARDKAAGK